ncbi:MAG: hypothetical protein K6E14_01245 [Paludibacteraceae bacterium]|nr:hypothetical protein [Paludibacteraceae bacterium]
MKINYKKLWLTVVQIRACKGFDFNDLIDKNEDDNNKYIGAWANVLVKASTITEVVYILNEGLKELQFEVVFIDKISNMASLVEENEVSQEIISDADSLFGSDYKYVFCDELWPYV